MNNYSRIGNLKYKAVDGNTRRRLDAMLELPFIELHPGRVIMISSYLEVADRISNLQVRPDDVWVISYPRTGSVWTQEMVWLINSNLDYEGAKVDQRFRAPRLEFSSYVAHLQENTIKVSDSIDFVESKESPRYIKSHLTFELLPTQMDSVCPKIVYVARDPKDTCVSYYYFMRQNLKINSTFEDFAELMLEGLAPIGCIWKHILSAWSRRNDPNFLFLKYEDMKKDLRGAIQLTADFLGKSLTNEEVIKLVDYLSFSKMRSNLVIHSKESDPEFINFKFRYMRKGEVGDWKNHMSEELGAMFDSKSVEMFRGSGLNYPC